MIVLILKFAAFLSHNLAMDHRRYSLMLHAHAWAIMQYVAERQQSRSRVLVIFILLIYYGARCVKSLSQEWKAISDHVII